MRRTAILVMATAAALFPAVAEAQSPDARPRHLAGSTGRLDLVPLSYTGSMAVTISTFEDCDGDGTPEQTESQSFEHPATVILGAPVADDATLESNPFDLLIGPSTAAGLGQPGEVWPGSATVLTTPDTARQLMVQYWDLLLVGDQLTGTLVDSHRDLAAVTNLVWDDTELVPCPDRPAERHAVPIARGRHAGRHARHGVRRSRDRGPDHRREPPHRGARRGNITLTGDDPWRDSPPAEGLARRGVCRGTLVDGCEIPMAVDDPPVAILAPVDVRHPDRPRFRTAIVEDSSKRSKPTVYAICPSASRRRPRCRTGSWRTPYRRGAPRSTRIADGVRPSRSCWAPTRPGD